MHMGLLESRDGAVERERDVFGFRVVLKGHGHGDGVYGFCVLSVQGFTWNQICGQCCH